MVLVAGPDTHAAPPSHNLYQSAEHRGTPASESEEKGPASFWRELGNDLGLPASWGTPRSLAEAEEAVISAALLTTENVSRPEIELEKRKLTSEEQWGVYTLLGLLGGSWLLGGLLAPSKPSGRDDEHH